MNYEVISTGSKGNAVRIENILIDCGVFFKLLRGVYKRLELVILTHIHIDHFRPSTIRKLAAERPTLRFGCCNWMVKHLIDCGVKSQQIDVYDIGKKYKYKSFSITPIKLYHDVPNCGYRLFFGKIRAIYATDTSTLDGIQAKGYDYYFIEANHGKDEIKERIKQKQENGEYAYEIRAAQQHLSKEQADNFIYANITSKGEYVYLHGHDNVLVGD